MIIVGLKHVNFTSRDGGSVNGWQVFASEPITENGAGDQVTKEWCKPEVMEQYFSKGAHPEDFIGAECTFLYNRYGKVQNLLVKGK